MEVYTLTTWNDFADIAKNRQPKPTMFRGVTRESYDLIPKIGRPETFKLAEYSEHFEKQMVIDFERRARAHRPDISGMNKMEALVLAQHHGLPTRLLDWTESLQVAAYFAVEPSGTEGDAAIYAAEAVDTVFTDVEKPFESGRTLVIYPPHISPRVSAQHGIFTLHNKPTEPYRSKGLVKYVIPEGLCLRFKFILDGLGVNRASLFPDLDGLSKNIEWRFKWSKLLRKMPDKSHS